MINRTHKLKSYMILTITRIVVFSRTSPSSVSVCPELAIPKIQENTTQV